MIKMDNEILLPFYCPYISFSAPQPTDGSRQTLLGSRIEDDCK